MKYRISPTQEAIAAATDSQLHLYNVPHAATDEPKTDAPGRWAQCTPQTSSNFSAVAYFFGRDLRKTLGVPVGLIQSAVGGTPAEAWTARATLAADPDLKPILEGYEARLKAYDPVKATADHKQALEERAEVVKKAKAEGKTPPKAPQTSQDPAKSQNRPAGLRRWRSPWRCATAGLKRRT